MTVWSKIAEENAASVSIHANVRFGIPGNWTTPVAVNGTTLTTATAFGRVTNPALLCQLQADSADAINRYKKIMIIGDQLTQPVDSTSWRVALYNLIAAQSAVFYPTDFVGNATYTANTQAYDPDNNAYLNYVATDLNKTSGTGTPGTGFLGDSRDVTSWFNEQAPDIVIVHLGTNDCVAGAITTANITTAYNALLTAARAANANVIFYVCKLIQNLNGTINTRISTLNTAIAAWVLTKETNQSPVETIDMNTSFNTGTMLQGGGTLPNATGAAFMALQAFNKLDPWLLKPAKYPVPTGQPFDRVRFVQGVVRAGLSGINLDSALYFWLPGKTGNDPMAAGYCYKLPANIFTVVRTGGNDCHNEDAFSSFSWTAVTANLPPSSAGLTVSNTQTIGFGYTITFPNPTWPTWYTVRIYTSGAYPRQLTYSISSTDPKAITEEVRMGDPVFGTSMPWYDTLMLGEHVYHDFRVSSDVAGSTCTIAVNRNGTSMGYWMISAIAVFAGTPGTLRQTPPTVGLQHLGGVG